MTKVLVTGAAGFIGRNLIENMRQSGYEVAGCDTKPQEVSRTGIKYATVNLLDVAGIEGIVKNEKPEIVVHLGARTDLLGTTSADYAANTDGVKNIMSACVSSSVRRVVFASSRMVCRIDHIPCNYNEYSPPNEYGRSKMTGELLVRSAQVPFEWVIVRPTSIWGPGFGIPYRNFFDQVRKRRYFHPGSHRPLKSFGYVENTVFQLQKLIHADAQAVHGRTFYLGDYEPLDLARWANYIHQSFGFKGHIRAVPMPFLRAAAKIGDGLNKIVGFDRAPLTTFRLKNLITDMVYPQLSELRTVTGDLPCDWRVGTERTVAWLQSTGG